MKKILFLKILVIIVLYSSGQDTGQTFLDYIRQFDECQFPLNSFDINRTHGFDKLDKFHRIDMDNLTKYFINDTSEIGYHYSIHGMDDYDKIYTGYVYIRYFIYRWFKIDSLHYGVIYEKRDQGNSCFLLSIFNKEGAAYNKLLISNDVQDQYYTEALIADKLNVEIVKYFFVETKKTRIVVNDFRYNLESNSFDLIKQDSTETEYYYYDYLKHNIENDPLFIQGE